MKSYIILMLCVLVSFFVTEADNEDIKKLIDKIDSNQIKEREESLNQLKNMAKNDSKVLELLKKESENENNSYNIRFFLKKLVKGIEQEKEPQAQIEPKEELPDTKDKQETIGIGMNKSFGKMSITMCNNNRCQTYEANSCDELLQKYPELKNQINCKDSFSFNLFNKRDDIFESFKKFQEDFIKGMFDREKEWQKKYKQQREVPEMEDRKKSDKIMKYVDIGMDIEELSDEELSKLQINSGIRVINIQKGGLADAELKLKENDIIISINDEKIYNKWTLKRQLKSFLNGESIKVEIYRDGKVQILQY